MSESGNPSPYGRPCEEWADAIVEHAMRPEARPGAALEEHLAGCRECSAYLEWLSPATGVLAEAVPTVAPSGALKDRVMSEVRANAADRAPSPSPLGRLASPRWALAGIAAASVLIAGVLAVGLGSGDGPGAEPSTYSLSMSSGGAVGELVAEGDTGILHLEGMRQAPSGHVYQAWIRHGQRLQPSSVFAVSHAGIAEASIPHGMKGADEVLVTVEPSGGSTEPTGRPRLAVSLD